MMGGIWGNPEKRELQNYMAFWIVSFKITLHARKPHVCCLVRSVLQTVSVWGTAPQPWESASQPPNQAGQQPPLTDRFSWGLEWCFQPCVFLSDILPGCPLSRVAFAFSFVLVPPSTHPPIHNSFISPSIQQIESWMDKILDSGPRFLGFKFWLQYF